MGNTENMQAINLAKLKGKIREKGKTYQSCAEYLGIGVSQFCRKITGKVDFWFMEVVKLTVFLELSTDEYCAIFLNY